MAAQVGNDVLQHLPGDQEGEQITQNQIELAGKAKGYRAG